MPNNKLSRTQLHLKRAELLENRTVLSGAAIVQPFSNVDYFGDASKDWALNAVNAPEVWAQGYSGEDIVIAVIDTGVDVYHEDLVHNIWTNDGEIPGNDIDDDRNGFVDDVYGWDFVDQDNDVADASGHGTAVSGAIAASRNDVGVTGVAYNAEIMVIRVLNADGVGSQLDISAGIRYAIANGADVINMSLGGTPSKRISSALKYAETQGVFVVAASGNDGFDEPEFPAGYSAEFGNVISVGAFKSDFELTDFSNTVGDTGAIQVEAPGQNVYSTMPDDLYQYTSGTSIAAPFVSGVVALAMSANPDLSAEEIRDLVTAGADLEIAYSDSNGGLNAATTVALAAAQAAPEQTVAAEAEADPEPEATEQTSEADATVDESAPDEQTSADDASAEGESPSGETTEPTTTPGDPSTEDPDTEAPKPEIEDPTNSEAGEPSNESEAPSQPITDSGEENEVDPFAEITLAHLGDIDGNGEVDFGDFLTFSRNFGDAVEQAGILGDLDRDGTVGFNDFLTFSRNFGLTLDEVFAAEESDLLTESMSDQMFDE